MKAKTFDANLKETTTLVDSGETIVEQKIKDDDTGLVARLEEIEVCGSIKAMQISAKTGIASLKIVQEDFWTIAIQADFSTKPAAFTIIRFSSGLLGKEYFSKDRGWVEIPRMKPEDRKLKLPDDAVRITLSS